MMRYLGTEIVLLQYILGKSRQMCLYSYPYCFSRTYISESACCQYRRWQLIWYKRLKWLYWQSFILIHCLINKYNFKTQSTITHLKSPQLIFWCATRGFTMAWPWCKRHEAWIYCINYACSSAGLCAAQWIRFVRLVSRHQNWTQTSVNLASAELWSNRTVRLKRAGDRDGVRARFGAVSDSVMMVLVSVYHPPFLIQVKGAVCKMFCTT